MSPAPRSIRPVPPDPERPFVSFDTTLAGDVQERRFVIGATAGVVESLRRNGTSGSPGITITPHREGLLRVTLSLPFDGNRPQETDEQPETVALDPTEPLTGEPVTGSPDWQVGSLLDVRTRRNRGSVIIVGSQIGEILGAFRRSSSLLAPYAADIIDVAHRQSMPK